MASQENALVYIVHPWKSLCLSTAVPRDMTDSCQLNLAQTKPPAAQGTLSAPQPEPREALWSYT